jgi:cyclophilin family peptidyl-prolyl cis-trans isomerase
VPIYSEEIFMRRLAQQIFSLLRKRTWLERAANRRSSARRDRNSLKLHLEALEDRFLPATSVTQLIPATLTGTAFFDHNRNNLFDAGELVLPGATITLSGTDLQGNSVSATAVTDAKGVYKFLQVKPGTYQISITTNSSIITGQASAGSQGGVVSGSVISSIAIAQGQTLVGYNLAVQGFATQGVSLRQFLSTTILVNGVPLFSQSSTLLTPGSGLAYADGAPPPAILTAAGTGSLSGTVQDTTGHAMVGVTVGLTGVTSGGANGGLPTFFSTTTDATGSYSFNNIAAGSYSINIPSQPAGFRAGLPTIGNLDGFIKQNDTIAGIDVTTTAGTGYNFSEIPVAGPIGTAPAVEAHLVDDTAGGLGTTNDNITADPTIGGTVANVGQVLSFTGTLDLGAPVNLPVPRADGSFVLNAALLTQMAAGGVLGDGQHALTLDVTGSAGSATTTFNFTLQTGTPPAPVVHLDTTSDPGQIGRPIQNNVTILGTTVPNAKVDLLSSTGQLLATTNTTNGDFSFNQTLNAGPNDFTVRVTDNAGNQNQTDATFVVDRAPTGSLSTVAVSLPAANQVLDLASAFTDPDTSNTILRFNTSFGPVLVQLNDANAPQTVANFLNYVKSGRFNNTIFHRLAINQTATGPVGFVLQGGGFTLAAAPVTTIDPVVTGPTVKNEFPTSPPSTGVNTRGTLAMAKVGNDPNSATSQWFFNLSDNHTNLDSQNGGFTVFASIADGFSQRIVDNMSSQKVFDESSATGTALNTVQQITINGAPTGGTFTLSLNGTATAPIAFNATAAAVQTALAALPSPTGTGTVGAANVTVTGGNGSYTVTFVGNLAGTSVAQLGSFSNLTGGTSPSVTVAVTTPGSSANGALNEIPLVNYNGTNFPKDATSANFEVVQSVDILRNTEFLTYAITANTNPAVASASLDPVFNNRLTLQFLTAGTTSITVVATDLSNRSVSATFSVTVNPAASNQAPVISAQTFNVPEGGTTGTVVGTVQASDPDVGQTLTYAITAGNTDNTFAINSTTGQITVANSADLNKTTHPSFALTVQVTDSGTPAQSSSATVTVNVVANQAPAIANQSFNATAGTANGTAIGTVVATDAGQPLTYAITAGNTGGAFQINASTGQLTVASSAALTTANGPFALTVSVTDHNTTSPQTSSATVTVNVAANQAPTIANQSFQVSQTATTGTAVGTVVASPGGLNQTLTYAIAAGNTNGAFAINPLTGQITVGDPTSLPTNSPFTLTVQVTDNNSTPLSSSATVTITSVGANTAPSIPNKGVNLPDGSPNGTIVTSMAGTDPDAGQTLTYAITAGNVGNTFQIDPATGQVTVANNANLNLATFPSFSLTVQVTDNGVPPLSSTGTLTISLTPNTPPTIANQTFSIPHGSSIGALVGAVVANDPDPNQTVIYAIVAGNTNNTFQIDAHTGQITVADNTSLTTANSPFVLTVKVTDDDARPLSSSATVTVNVT